MVHWQVRVMEIWFVIDPFDLSPIALYSTKEEASRDSIERNKKSENHPAYLLYCLDTETKEVQLVGGLWRAFGYEFDPSDCWR